MGKEELKKMLFDKYGGCIIKESTIDKIYKDIEAEIKSLIDEREIYLRMANDINLDKEFNRFQDGFNSKRYLCGLLAKAIKTYTDNL